MQLQITHAAKGCRQTKQVKGNKSGGTDAGACSPLRHMRERSGETCVRPRDVCSGALAVISAISRSRLLGPGRAQSSAATQSTGCIGSTLRLLRHLRGSSVVGWGPRIEEQCLRESKAHLVFGPVADAIGREEVLCSKQKIARLSIWSTSCISLEVTSRHHHPTLGPRLECAHGCRVQGTVT